MPALSCLPLPGRRSPRGSRPPATRGGACSDRRSRLQGQSGRALLLPSSTPSYPLLLWFKKNRAGELATERRHCSAGAICRRCSTSARVLAHNAPLRPAPAFAPARTIDCAKVMPNWAFLPRLRHGHRRCRARSAVDGTLPLALSFCSWAL
jgi:hypothetical protein